MGTKTISIDDEAYRRLKGQKQGKESFSDVIKRLTSPTSDISKFFGCWALTEEEEKVMRKRIAILEQDMDDMLGQ